MVSTCNHVQILDDFDTNDICGWVDGWGEIQCDSEENVSEILLKLVSLSRFLQRLKAG